MAPNLSSKSNKISKKTKLEKNIKKQLLNFRKYIEKNCKMLVKTLLKKQEAFIMIKKLHKGIYGKATPEETSELLEEGIEVATIPWVR